MKKKIDLVDKEHNSEKWKSGSFDDESGNKLKRQRWKMFWVVFPKRANVTPVFKADAKDVVKNYRSISLLSIPSKCQEDCVLCCISACGSLSDRLAAWAYEGTFMCYSVSIIDHLEWGQKDGRCFPGLAKAFSIVAHNILLQKIG